MSKIFPARGLYRIVRANTLEMSQKESSGIRFKLSIAYAISAVAGYCALNMAYNKKYEENKEKFGGDYDDNHFWLQKLGHKEATILKVSGFNFKKVEEERYNFEELKAQAAEKEALVAQTEFEAAKEPTE